MPKEIGHRYFSNEKIMKPQKINGNRYQVRLTKNGNAINYRIHRIVAETFIPNPNNYPQVNHIDENPLNNKVGNLEWCTSNYNLHYGTRIERSSKKHKKPVLSESKDGKIKIYSCIKEASAFHNVDRSAIIRCCKKKQKVCRGLKWFYVADFIKILTYERDFYKQKYEDYRKQIKEISGEK